MGYYSHGIEIKKVVLRVNTDIKIGINYMIFSENTKNIIAFYYKK